MTGSPRAAVTQFIEMGVDTAAPVGPQLGLRVIGGGMRMELAWPELSSYPTTG